LVEADGREPETVSHRNRLPTLGLDAIRLTFDWDLHFLPFDDIHLSTSAISLWESLYRLRFFAPVQSGLHPENRIVDAVIKEVSEEWRAAGDAASQVADRVAHSHPDVRPSRKEGDFERSKSLLSDAWRAIVPAIEYVSRESSLDYFTQEVLAYQLDVVRASMPRGALGYVEPVGFIHAIRTAGLSLHGERELFELSERVARRWTIFRRDSRVDIRASLDRLCEDQDMRRSSAKSYLISIVMNSEVQKLDRPNLVRIGQQWLKRTLPGDSDPRRRPVWIIDRCPYLMWKWYGNQLIRKAESTLADDYPVPGCHDQSFGEGEQYARLISENDSSSAVETIFSTMETVEVYLAKAGLSERQAEIWVASQLGERKVEIAGRLGLTPGAVRAHLFRARQKIARLKDLPSIV
jgi:DNA-directed RNA polymerase specialized sigma24 family protein